MVHDPEARAERHRLLLVVGNHDERHPQALLDIDELKLGMLAQLLVQGGQRLVEQQQFRPLHQRACQRDALALAAGELVRLARTEATHLHDLEYLLHLAPDVGAAHALLLESERHVLLDVHVREERVGLEHHVHRALVGRNGAHVRAIDVQGARGGCLETGQHAQQRRLARTGASQQAEDLPAPDVQRDVVDGHKVAEFLGDVEDANVGRRIGSGGCRRGGRFGDAVRFGVHFPVFTRVHMRVSSRW